MHRMPSAPLYRVLRGGDGGYAIVRHELDIAPLNVAEGLTLETARILVKVLEEPARVIRHLPAWLIEDLAGADRLGTSAPSRTIEDVRLSGSIEVNLMAADASDDGLAVLLGALEEIGRRRDRVLRSIPSSWADVRPETEVSVAVLDDWARTVLSFMAFSRDDRRSMVHGQRILRGREASRDLDQDLGMFGAPGLRILLRHLGACDNYGLGERDYFSARVIEKGRVVFQGGPVEVARVGEGVRMESLGGCLSALSVPPEDREAERWGLTPAEIGWLAEGGAWRLATAAESVAG